MKLDKKVIDRRQALMEEEGSEFVTNARCRQRMSGQIDLLKEYDAVVLACGASNPRDIKAPGREAKGIYFAVDFLKRVDKESARFEFCKIKNICCRKREACHRHRWRRYRKRLCRHMQSVWAQHLSTQLEMMPKAAGYESAGQSMARVAESLQDRLRPGGSDCRVRT